MKARYHFIFFCFLIFIQCSALLAKEFKIISLDDFGKIQQIKFQDESATQKINVKKYTPNRSFPVPKQNLIHFYGIDSDTGAYSKKPLLRISFENQKTDSIIFLQSDEEDLKKINYEFFDNDDASFPELSTLIINNSDKRVIANIGGEIIKLTPNTKKLVNLTKNERGSFSDKVIFAARTKDQSINYFYSSFWRVPSGRKTICIIDFDEKLSAHKLSEILL